MDIDAYAISVIRMDNARINRNPEAHNPISLALLLCTPISSSKLQHQTPFMPNRQTGVRADVRRRSHVAAPRTSPPCPHRPSRHDTHTPTTKSKRARNAKYTACARSRHRTTQVKARPTGNVLALRHGAWALRTAATKPWHNVSTRCSSRSRSLQHKTSCRHNDRRCRSPHNLGASPPPSARSTPLCQPYQRRRGTVSHCDDSCALANLER